MIPKENRERTVGAEFLFPLRSYRLARELSSANVNTLLFDHYPGSIGPLGLIDESL